MAAYERFDCWQRCHALALAIYKSTSKWPASERFGLVFQLRKAAFSAPANIVEGSAKRGTAEFRRFLDISLGSLAEINYALRLARDVGILPVEEWKAPATLQQQAGRSTWLLYRSLKR
ncbi:MAG TPA: four helix bundle protein [Gemmatimonadales bacterium]|nr:four helix bundle protein [Gemmatimonadales bacterium]